MINEDIKNLMQGISSLSQMTQKLGDRAMQGDNPNNIMREGSDIRNMVKGMDFEVTKLEGRSKKDNPSVYDVEVDQYTTDETGKVKSRINELMEATADFDNAMGMQMGGLSNQMVGDPKILVPDDPTARQQESELIRAMDDPILRLIQRQRAGFYPQLGFGADPYALDIARGLGQKIETFPEGTSGATTTSSTEDILAKRASSGEAGEVGEVGLSEGIGRGSGSQTYESVINDLSGGIGGITNLPGSTVSDYIPSSVNLPGAIVSLAPTNSTGVGSGFSQGVGDFFGNVGRGIGGVFGYLFEDQIDFAQDIIDIIGDEFDDPIDVSGPSKSAF